MARRRRRSSSTPTQCQSVIPILIVCMFVCTTSHRRRYGVVEAFLPPTTKCTTTTTTTTTWSNGKTKSSFECPTTRLDVAAATATTMMESATVPSFDYSSAIDLPWMDYIDTTTFSSLSSNTPVIFLHGLLGNKRNFQTLASGLGSTLKMERRLIGMDLRNHGDNINMMDSMSYSDMAYDVLSTLDRHVLLSSQKNHQQKIILVGHSMGAKVAQALALLMPHRVEGMVLLDMAPVTYDHEEPSWKTVCDILHLLRDIVPPQPTTTTLENNGPIITKRQVDQLLQQSLPDPALRAFCLTNWDASKSNWKIDLHKVCAELDTLRQFELSSTSTSLQFDGDVLLIHGGKSKFVKSSHLPTIKSYFPNHMLTTIRGAGHWVHAEAPDDVMLMLKRYLDR